MAGSPTPVPLTVGGTNQAEGMDQTKGGDPVAMDDQEIVDNQDIFECDCHLTKWYTPCGCHFLFSR